MESTDYIFFKNCLSDCFYKVKEKTQGVFLF